MKLSEAFISKLNFKYHIGGIVQGVGFRPFVYKLAMKHNLKGYVGNDGEGVIVQIEGRSHDINLFREELELCNPPLSRIDYIRETQNKLFGFKDFIISQSDESSISTMLSPDISLCDECRSEMQDKNNRRYNYPFINCTNCGPRYTIIENLPYDRDKTSMKKFCMCEECQSEYENPLNRRYHAEPISCHACGPQLKFIALNSTVDINAPIENAIAHIKNGLCVGVKGLGGFHIVCDATDEKAVSRLRLNKHRPTKPLAVMFKNISTIKKNCSLTKKEEEILLSKERPIVIVRKKNNTLLADSIAPNIDKIGVFLPYTPLHELLLKGLNAPIVATSANQSDEPIIGEEKELLRKLPLVIDGVLTHDREIVNACDDSVLLSTESQTIMLRMARGFAPRSFYFKEKTFKKILALGAHQKSTIALAFDNNIIMSPHIGDLNTIESFDYFLKTLKTLKRIYKFEPDVIVCDKHPNYETTKWAKKYVLEHEKIELLEVQHHYAHALSAMAEYSLDEEVLTFCFDGTGYGDDSKLWGGEVFVATKHHYKRVYRFKEIALLGGDRAVREPKRVALSLLYECFDLEEILEMECKILECYTVEEIKIFHKMFQKGINAPRSSSLGRLFDGVYALSGHQNDLGYEGESGLILETISKNSKTKGSYKYTLKDGIINYEMMIHQILKEKDKDKIAKKFITTITKIIVDIAIEFPNIPVVLSGGVFQNSVLVSQVSKALKKIAREYYIQSKTPVNDGGIALGQAYYAAKKYK